MHKINAKKNTKKNLKNSKTKISMLRRWYFWFILIIVIGVVVFLAIFIPRKIEEQRKIEEEKRIDEEISACVQSIGIDSMDFKSMCYESRNRTVPDEIKESDMYKVDLMIAQANYDECKAYATLRKNAVWDLNDTNPENLIMDPIRSYLVDFVNSEYQDTLKTCEEKYALSAPYNNSWDTSISYRLVGWIHDYTNIFVFDSENSQGIVDGATGIRADKRNEIISSGVGSVAYMVAYKFKQEHNSWWYR